MKKQIKQLTDHIKANYKKIDVVAGACRFNYECHHNAVHDAITNKQHQIAMCVYLHGNYPIVHFINIENDKYVDNTIGEWCSQYDYYLIRTIDESEFFDVLDIFSTYREELSRKSSWYLRIFSRYIP